MNAPKEGKPMELILAECGPPGTTSPSPRHGSRVERRYPSSFNQPRDTELLIFHYSRVNWITSSLARPSGPICLQKPDQSSCINPFKFRSKILFTAVFCLLILQSWAVLCVCCRKEEAWLPVLCVQMHNVSFIKGINWPQSHLNGDLINLLVMLCSAPPPILNPKGAQTHSACLEGR